MYSTIAEASLSRSHKDAGFALQKDIIHTLPSTSFLFSFSLSKSVMGKN